MRKALVRRGGQIIEVDVDDNYVNQLHKAQVGEQVPKIVYDEYDNEIISSKHRTRGNKDFTKYKIYDSDNNKYYTEKQTFNPETNTIRYSTREKGRLFPEIVNRYATEPNPFIPVEKYYNPYRSDFNSQPTLLPGMQMGDQVKGNKYDEYGNLIISSKHKIRRGKDFTKHVIRDPESGYTYISKETFDPESNTINYSIRGRNELFPNRGSYEATAPNPFIPVDRYNNLYESQFNSQPTFQMGGAPQEQMAQQQMPPQQEGQASQQDQIMQLIQAYAQAKGISPEEIIQQLQQMDPQAQQQAIQQMAQELQGAQQQAPQQEMPPEQMMQRGGNSKGADIVKMSTPEYKSDYFAMLTQKFGQNNYDKAFMKDMNNEFQKFQSGGYIQNADGTQSYDLGSGFDRNAVDKANMFQDNADYLESKGDTFGAFANVMQTGANAVGKVANTAAQVAMTAAGVPPGVTNSLTKSKGKDGSGGFDPSKLISMFAKFGGNLPKFQNTGQFNSGIGSFADSPAWNFGNPGLDTFMKDFELKNPTYGKQITPAPVANITMADQSKNTFDVFGPQDDPITTNATNPNKDKELIAGPDSVKKPNFSLSEMGATRGMGPAVAGLFEAMGNKGKAKQAEAFAQNALLSDNLFTSNTGDRIDRGDYVMNTQPNNANFRPDQNIPMGPYASEYGKYGMQLAKVGVQVQNPYLSNPNSHPEAILYGEPDPKVSNTLKPVKREQANLEAEVGEVAVTPAGPDGVPKFFKIGGKNHYEGGTPLNLPENTFIFSKTRSMIIKDPKILKELTGSTKPATPADLAKKFDYSEYVATIQNENSDPVERKTAQFMIENMMYKLGQIAIIQEAKKGFPNGIPLVAVPYLEKAGIAPESILPQMQQEPPMDPGMQQQMDPAMQQQMMQQPQEQMDPRMMQEQMEPMPEGQEPIGQPESMKQYPMARYGGSNLERYQKKGQVSNSALLNRISKDIKSYPHVYNTDSANKYLPWKNSDAIENYPLIYNTDSLRKYLPWNNEVPENNIIFYEPNRIIPPYQMGGTNIMGGPVLPTYQVGDQVMSRASTPNNPNFAQQVLGPLFNYIPEEEVVDIPISTEKTFETSSPQKGFKNYDELDKFLGDGEKLGVDLVPLYKAYSGAITAIQKLKQGLINGTVPFDIYEKEKEALTKRIDAIKSEISATNEAIPNIKSSSWNPWSTANKIQDLEDILTEEKSELNIKGANLKKFRGLQNNYSTLLNEKAKIEKKLNDESTDELEIMSLNRKLKDLDLAIYNENVNVNWFGERLIKNNSKAYSDKELNNYGNNLTNDPLKDALYSDALKNKEQPNPYKSGNIYTYKQYINDHGLFKDNTTNNTDISIEPLNEVAADSISKSTPAPVETPVKKEKSKSTVNRSQNTSTPTSTFKSNSVEGLKEYKEGEVNLEQ